MKKHDKFIDEYRKLAITVMEHLEGKNFLAFQKGHFVAYFLAKTRIII